MLIIMLSDIIEDPVWFLFLIIALVVIVLFVASLFVSGGDIGRLIFSFFKGIFG